MKCTCVSGHIKFNFSRKSDGLNGALEQTNQTVIQIKAENFCINRQIQISNDQKTTKIT